MSTAIVPTGSRGISASTPSMHYEQIRSFVVPANEQNFDRIEAEIARMSAIPTHS